MRQNFFEIDVVSVRWHNQHREMRHLPEGVAVRIAEDIRGWYQGLGDGTKYYVRSVRVTPEVIPYMDDGTWVRIELRATRTKEDTDIRNVPLGTESFAYDLNTQTTSTNPQHVSLKEALTTTLKRLLQGNINFLKFAESELERSVRSLGGN